MARAKAKSTVVYTVTAAAASAREVPGPSPTTRLSRARTQVPMQPEVRPATAWPSDKAGEGRRALGMYSIRDPAMSLPGEALPDG